VPHHYRVYGLVLESEIPIDGLSPIDAQPADLQLRVGEVAPLAHELDASWLDDEGARVTREDDAIVLEYRDETRFRIEPRAITTSWITTAADMATYLLGPVLAFALRMRGTLVLHASAVAVEGRALLFAGAAGAGKSTTAAAFVKRGATMITDDVAAIDRGAVLPGTARIRLWDDSAAALFGSADALPLLTPTWTKRYAQNAVADAPVPLHAIVILAGRESNTRVRKLAGHEAVMAVLARTSVPQLIDDAHRANELAQIVELVAATPVFELIVPDDFWSATALPAF
jgi:hypothetical protein